MSFDQNLIKLSVIGSIFLLFFGFLIRLDKQQIETVQQINDCSGCYAKRNKVIQEHKVIKTKLLKQMQDKQYEFKRLRQLTGQKMDCDGVDYINAENQKLVSRIFDLQQQQKHHNKDELTSELNKCKEGFEIIMSKIDSVYN